METVSAILYNGGMMSKTTVYNICLECLQCLGVLQFQELKNNFIHTIFHKCFEANASVLRSKTKRKEEEICVLGKIASIPGTCIKEKKTSV